jgi:hypothetical protein
MNKLALIIIAALIIAAYFMFPSITGLLVADEPTVTEYCGNGQCSDDEDCGSCPKDCELCRLRSSDVDVEMEWRGVSDKLCNGTGHIYGFIRLSDELEGTYYCTVSFGEEVKRFSITSPGKWDIFAGSMLLNQSHTAEFCCHSYSVDPDFCNTITIPAYC